MKLLKKVDIESFNKIFYTFLKENYPSILDQLDKKYCTKFNGLDSKCFMRAVQFKMNWYDENLPIPYLYSWEHYKLFQSLLWLCDGPSGGPDYDKFKDCDLAIERHVLEAIWRARKERNGGTK